MNFYQFLIKHRNEQSAIGDFAKDALDPDQERPDFKGSRAEIEARWVHYLEERRAYVGAIQGLKLALDCWQSAEQ